MLGDEAVVPQHAEHIPNDSTNLDQVLVCDPKPRGRDLTAAIIIQILFDVVIQWSSTPTTTDDVGRIQTIVWYRVETADRPVGRQHTPSISPRRYINVPLKQAFRTAYINNYLAHGHMWNPRRFSRRKFELVRPFWHFLALPPEVRNMVYDLLLVAAEPIERPFGPNCGPNKTLSRRTLHPALFYVSRQISQETRSAFYRHNRWVITDPMDIRATSNGELPILPMVSRIEFVFSPNPFGTTNAAHLAEILPDRILDWENYMFTNDLEVYSPLYRLPHLEVVTFDFSAIPYDAYPGRFPKALFDLILSWLLRQRDLRRVHLKGLNSDIVEHYKLLLCVEPQRAIEFKCENSVKIDQLILQKNHQTVVVYKNGENQGAGGGGTIS